MKERLLKPTLGVAQSQVLWAWILYLSANVTFSSELIKAIRGQAAGRKKKPIPWSLPVGDSPPRSDHDGFG